MGEIGKDFLPEDIFAEVEPDTSHVIVRKNDQTIAEMVQAENEANIDQKKGKNFDKKHIGKTSKKLFLLVLLFVFLILIASFVFVIVVSRLSLNNKAISKVNNTNNTIVEKTADSNSNPDDRSALLKDTDGDGLMDIEESSLNTDPKNPDTDNDLISDGEEVKKYHTNPLNPDTDGDGLSDYDEIFVYGTNPLSSDTDGDGYRDVDEITNGYSPIGEGKITPEYSQKIEIAKKLRDELTIKQK